MVIVGNLDMSGVSGILYRSAVGQILGSVPDFNTTYFIHIRIKKAPTVG